MMGRPNICIIKINTAHPIPRYNVRLKSRNEGAIITCQWSRKEKFIGGGGGRLKFLFKNTVELYIKSFQKSSFFGHCT